MATYALLIGINQYHPQSNVPPLDGCVNDVKLIQNTLEKWYGLKPENTVTLFDEEATYGNIIQHLGEGHLLKAGPDDQIYVHFSGHGARGHSAQAFHKYYPEGKDENLVCYDSRAKGGLDLSDKEMAVLIQRLADTGADVVVSVDSCHSGSVTRELPDFELGKLRQWEDRGGERPLETYLKGHFNEDNLVLPAAKHMLLAACDKKEKAFELNTGHGNFTTHLVEVLNQGEGNVSYAELYEKIRILMGRISDRQNPQFEPSGFFNSQAGFLGKGGGSAAATYQLSFDADNDNWVVNCGAIQGLTVDNTKPATFEIFENDKALGIAVSTLVGVEETTVKFESADLKSKLDQSKIYDARLLSIRTPKMTVKLTGSGKGKDRVKLALQTFQPLFFDLQEAVRSADYELKSLVEEVRLIRTADDAVLRTVKGNNEERIFADIFDYLEHIGQWERNWDLNNPASKMKQNGVELCLVLMDKAEEERIYMPEVLIDIFVQDAVEQEVRFRIEAENNTNQTLYCHLLYFVEGYGTFPIPAVEIPGNKSATLLENTPAGDPTSFMLNGANESIDRFKLIVSKTQLSSVGRLMQQPVEIGETATYRTTRGELANEKGIMRDRAIAGWGAPAEPENKLDWMTKNLTVKLNRKEVKVGEAQVVMADGLITIAATGGHFKADAGVIHAGSQKRSLENVGLLSEMNLGEDTELLTLGTKTRNTAPPNVLVLENIQNDEDLKSHPLKITLNHELEEGESIAAFTFDGQFIIPIGDATVEDGKGVVTISEIPDIQEERKRSLFKALKLCFMKTVLKMDVQFLRWVDYSGLKPVRRDGDIKGMVEHANNILVLAHGIIGDTQGMTECMRPLYQNKKYDLILTFDYENLNTVIEDNALALKTKLDEIGINDKNPDKKITILAHSMGGLVARYFIENLNGKSVVDKLIMAGTPNGGSAIAELTRYSDWAKVILGFVANSGWGLPAAATLLGILQKSEMLTVTLAQMRHDSELYMTLHSNPAPGIPYHILAGHLDQFVRKNAEGRSLLDKLLDAGGRLFYGEENNDIAVSISSILSVPDTFRAMKKEVACHHMNYFVDQESVEALMEVL